MLGDEVRRAAPGWEHSRRCEADCDGGIEMAAADVAERRDKDRNGEAVRERDGWIMIDAERYCRSGAD